MEDKMLSEYSNISDVDISKIPRSVIVDIANIIYSAMCNDMAETKSA